MILNPDCVRDVLLAVEKCGYGERLQVQSLSANLPQYFENDISYTCLKLDEAGYLDIVTISTLDSTMPIIVAIKDLTYPGHEFLNNIRETKTWDKVKDTAKKTGVDSLRAIASIAKQVAAATIIAALGHS